MANTLEFINSKDNLYFKQNLAAKAYTDYIDNHGGSGQYAYFRTKYNNKVKSLSLDTSPEVTGGPVETTVDTVDTAAFTLPTRKSVDYMNGDIIPEMPDLIPTGTIFDILACDRITTKQMLEDYEAKTGLDMPAEEIQSGGFTRKCADIRVGKAGAGKTYLTSILAAKAKVFARREQNKNIRVGLISGEMRDTEWAKELNTCELLKEIEVDYMLDYVGYSNYMEIFWEAVADYDIVIVDSLPAVISHFKMSWDIASMGKMPTENQLIFKFINKILKSVKENNNNVQIINQATKDGNYKGGTELPHMLSSMSFVKVEGQQRYIEFAKNRNNGKVNRKLYF